MELNLESMIALLTLAEVVKLMSLSRIIYMEKLLVQETSDFEGIQNLILEVRVQEE